ncbi:hypothetical protein CCYS_02430 [Corynebacterium cystitidis DSM 20524]|uniref:DUF218 domain-containing protein n=2 Tax=Corynebacterium cystitidis TaxID=35757 RepID=A0A1H9RGU3_9CORY|nr:hypothetical protein CCYS_02430 [Corynebacterium cystitidis DSM 20524]SER71199.1 hypothetical protein SAMN05661109_00871 [Corynebacterium cystitidis DSM 20524]SNV87303.1 Uncharacterised protein [Corynebacterium cystitidis]
MSVAGTSGSDPTPPATKHPGHNTTARKLKNCGSQGRTCRAWALLDEPTQLTVVTNNFHALRTKVWAWHLGIPIEVVEAPTPPESKLRNYPRVIIALPHSITRVLWRTLKAVLG